MITELIHQASPTTVSGWVAPTMLVEKKRRSPARSYAPRRCNYSEGLMKSRPRGTGITVFPRALEESESPCTAPAFHELQPLRHLTTVCAWCNKVLDSEGFWRRAKTDIRADRDAKVSHGICPECAEKSYNAYRLERESAVLRFSTQVA